MPTPQPTPERIRSLDQFRGYTVAGMFLVNFLGGFGVTPGILKHHHDYCSYADTIMPQFLFAVGFAFRLTFERRVERDGLRVAYLRVVRRLLGLSLLSVVIYSVGHVADDWAQLVEIGPAAVLARVCKRDWFQTLMHIAATSLWILPVLRSRARTRIVFVGFSAALHVILSWWFNFEWCNTSPNAIDGGPLGFLTWSIPAITGTMACDLLQLSREQSRWLGLLFGSFVLMAAGWGLSCGTRFYDVPATADAETNTGKLARHPVLPTAQQRIYRGLAEPPFVPPPDTSERKWNYWMMSQRAGTLSYLTFGAGVSMFVFAGFYLICDKAKKESLFLRVFGSNALAGYVLHLMLMDAMDPFIPRDAPGWYVLTALVAFFAVMWIFVRHLDRNKIFIRL